jgi:Na+/H+ antiporter NhaD/arsenite permease-like protein
VTALDIRHVLADWQIIAAWIVFLASYFVFAFGRLPGTKIDRPAMAVVGAVLMFVFRILTPQTAIGSVDFGTLVLLFAMMLIVASLHLAGFSTGSATASYSISLPASYCPA